jgi:hypothetical protein
MEIDWPSVTISAAALIIAGGAYLETRKARKVSERSAKASEASAEASQRSALAAEKSVEAADRSATAAEQSAAEAASMTEIESGRRADELAARHNALAPPHPGEVLTSLEEGTNGQLSLFGTISLPADFYVEAEGWNGNSLTPVTGLPNHLDAHKAYTFHIEHWPHGSTVPVTQEIRLRLWPPFPERKLGNPWKCPCEKPSNPAECPTGHWQLHVPIKPPTIPMVRFL